MGQQGLQHQWDQHHHDRRANIKLIGEVRLMMIIMIMIIMMMVQMKPENLGQRTEKEKELKKGGAQ